jgi:succinate dehydrogenase flavin-adding protein (antitoxin of CptAB toxin-antitoxin module)
MSSLKSFENFPKDSIKFMDNYRESSSSFLGQSGIQKSIGMDASNAGNINQLYSNLLKEYEKLNNSYNELLNWKQETITTLNSLNNEKQKLLKESENSLTEKLQLKSELELTKQKLKLSEFQVKHLKNNNNNSNTISEKIIEEKDEEIRKLNEKNSELEKNYNGLKTSSVDGENKNIIEEIEEKSKTMKSFYEEEIRKLKADFQKEKDNYSLIIKVKDEEIMKLVKNKEDIKSQEAKKYEKIIAKYEQINWVEVETLDETERGDGGFGHSGVK